MLKCQNNQGERISVTLYSNNLHNHSSDRLQTSQVCCSSVDCYVFPTCRSQEIFFMLLLLVLLLLFLASAAPGQYTACRCQGVSERRNSTIHGIQTLPEWGSDCGHHVHETGLGRTLLLDIGDYVHAGSSCGCDIQTIMNWS